MIERVADVGEGQWRLKPMKFEKKKILYEFFMFLF